MARDAHLCATVGTFVALALCAVGMLSFGYSLKRDYDREYTYYQSEYKRVRKYWLYECSDDREQPAHEIQHMCSNWRLQLDRFRDTGVRNIALASTLDAWCSWYMDGIGTRLVQLGYNLVFMVVVIIVCTGFLMLCAAMLIKHVASFTAQQGYALPGAAQPNPVPLLGWGRIRTPEPQPSYPRVELIDESRKER